jgi:hypothetical protein
MKGGNKTTAANASPPDDVAGSTYRPIVATLACVSAVLGSRAAKTTAQCLCVLLAAAAGTPVLYLSTIITGGCACHLAMSLVGVLHVHAMVGARSYRALR